MKYTRAMEIDHKLDFHQVPFTGKQVFHGPHSGKLPCSTIPITVSYSTKMRLLRI